MPGRPPSELAIAPDCVRRIGAATFNARSLPTRPFSANDALLGDLETDRLISAKRTFTSPGWMPADAHQGWDTRSGVAFGHDQCAAASVGRGTRARPDSTIPSFAVRKTSIFSPGQDLTQAFLETRRTSAATRSIKRFGESSCPAGIKQCQRCKVRGICPEHKIVAS